MRIKKAKTIKFFFDSWSTYKKIIHFNYMAHKEIHSELKNFLDYNINWEVDFLDLGCGDCSQIIKTFDDIKVKNYIGIDISSGQLVIAKKKS